MRSLAAGDGASDENGDDCEEHSRDHTTSNVVGASVHNNGFISVIVKSVKAPRVEMGQLAPARFAAQVASMRASMVRGEGMSALLAPRHFASCLVLGAAASVGALVGACRTASPTPLLPGELALSPLTLASTDPTAFPTVATAPLGAWWVVESVTRADEMSTPGSLWHFSEDEYDVVKLPSACERQRTDLHAAGEARWKADKPYPYELRREGARLVVFSPTPSAVTITMRGARRDEAAAADEALSHHASITDTCVRAQRCLEEAGRLLAYRFDVRAEIGDASSMYRCERTVAGAALVLERAKKPLPASCE